MFQLSVFAMVGFEVMVLILLLRIFAYAHKLQAPLM